MAFVVVLMGSKSDLPFVAKITAVLDELGIAYERRIASAHKSARYLLDMLAAYEKDGHVDVYITVAGRSNALSGVVDANVAAPVIACPPYSDKFAGADLYSSLRLPSGVAPAVILEPAAAALLAAKIIALRDRDLRELVTQWQETQRAKLVAADKELTQATRTSALQIDTQSG